MSKVKKRYKIMIAEDDDGIMDAMKLMLEMDGYEVVQTDDGQTVQEMKQGLPDLLLLDVWMSGTDGRKVCKFLKTQKETKHLPIILVSAGRDLAKSAKTSGADDYLVKPFDMDDLLAMVKKYTG